ncbi:hypothetical protein H8356DRAFT_1297751 [Neocallimastix lanati (nom. inval.)]|uniref:Uncharacterized protein n=1 Tax=Neocallimastix californiae TaxID=1754190 RepID=A0A1Y2ALP6_9FUNG|nr:hypothetical protein H8356DRAFT_1297751 [Neocallimastix sp. JGI-2020a]ORY22875.1 hypothetical protein LY90DRAFT_127871 [Neocallimastix californiae]|eukprot:ORY22875.1 hypothetical protein LY90DRAFT_127871 [Neocallimastix californiae]
MESQNKNTIDKIDDFLTINKFLCLSQSVSIKICSGLLILGLVLLNIIEISRWYKEDAPLMIIAIALMDISILCGMILFFIGLKKNEMKFINFYMKLLYLYIVIVIFQYFLFVINEILYKFVIDEKKNEMAADLYNKFKSSHEGLSDNETKSLMKKLSLLKISIVTVIFIYIIYYVILIKTYVRKLVNRDKEEKIINAEDTAILIH